MQLDIRLPIGLLFTVLGILLIVVGALSSTNALKQSQGFNVDLWWGIVMLIFGVVMFLFGRRGTATARLAEESPEGKKMEEIEHEAAGKK